MDKRREDRPGGRRGKPRPGPRSPRRDRSDGPRPPGDRPKRQFRRPGHQPPATGKPVHKGQSPPHAGPRTDWGKVAGWYDELVGDAGSEYQREIVHPGVVRLLHLQPGQSCLDVGCGQGVLCRILHEHGVHVTGIDAARELIHIARERGPAEIRYEVADARDLSGMPDSQFDAACCSLAIQNIHPIQPVFRSIERVLKPNGRLVMVMMHPCFRGPKETSWGWDEHARVQYRRVDRYMLPRKAPIVTNPGKDPNRYTWTFHKPLEAYVKAMRAANLFIDTLEEWTSHKTTQTGPRAAAENQARKEIPLFLTIRAVHLVTTPRAVDEKEPAGEGVEQAGE